jgi:ribosome-binding protein aMBF1 (putative translation factor)
MNETTPQFPLTMTVLRKRKGMTQIKLAKRVGRHQSDIAYYESASLTPNEETAKKLAEVLGCEPEDLQKTWTSA